MTDRNPGRERKADATESMKTETATQAGYSYLLDVRCPDCDENTEFVQTYSSPVALDMDIAPNAAFCPFCGESRLAEDAEPWDVHEEAQIERVEATGPNQNRTEGDE